jgi:hypothetical protein
MIVFTWFLGAENRSKNSAKKYWVIIPTKIT